MLRDASQDVAVHLKDRLRDMRDFLRAHRHDQRHAVPAPRPLGEIEGILGRAVSVVDDTLTLAESVSRTMLPGRRDGQVVLRPLDAYFAGDGAAGEQAFRRHMYRAAKLLAATLDDEEPPVIRETALAGAHMAVRRRHGHLLLALRGAPPAAARPLAAGLLAALLQEICRATPSEEPSSAHGRDDLCIRCFAPGLLASALLLFDDGLAFGKSERDAGELLDIATLGIAARSERMARSLQADRPITELTAIFESLLTHLP